MTGKPKVSPNDTYILDEDDVDALDDLSFTTILDDATDSLERATEAQSDSPEPADRPPSSGHQDQEINDLIDLMSSETRAADSTSTPSDEKHDLESPASEDLLAPEMLFPGEGSDEDAGF